MKFGKLIVMEGACDGIGKTTQYTLLRDHLQQDGELVVSHHFPSYHTYQGEPVTRYLQGNYGNTSELSPYFINSLYAQDRAITWLTELKQHYENGETILLDRYTTSSLIYQAALIEDLEERKKFIDYIIDFEYSKLGVQSPDQVIFLTAPFELVTEIRNQRSQNDGVVNDIHERDLSFMKKVYENALFIADYLSWSKVECNDGKFMKPIEDIHQEVYQLVKQKK